MIGRFFQPPKHDRWDDYFEEGEVLLWHGAPEPGPRSFLLPVFLSIFGIPFLLAGLGSLGTGLSSLFDMSGAIDLGFALFTIAFSIPFLAVGGALVFGTWILAFIEHKYVRYALSNKRAYVARSLWGHKLESYRIGPEDAITLEQGKYDSVRFKTIHGVDSDGDKTSYKIGFEGISQGRDVYNMIRQIQKDAQ